MFLSESCSFPDVCLQLLWKTGYWSGRTAYLNHSSCWHILHTSDFFFFLLTVLLVSMIRPLRFTHQHP